MRRSCIQAPTDRATFRSHRSGRPMLVAAVLLATLSGVSMAALARAAPQDPLVVSLGQRLPQGYPQGARGAVLARELARQALLIAARDEFGLSTRDDTLREATATPADPQVAGRTLQLQLMATTITKKSVNVQVFESGAWLTTAWQRDIPLGDSPIDYVALVETMEGWTRKELVEFLKLQGCRDHRPPPTPAELDPACALRVEEMSFLAQLDAVQRAHAHIRVAGASPASLSVLVRGYAHLGMLTEWHWNSAFKAHFARALLYAQRMTASAPTDPSGWAHRAYAEALAGLHAAALADLEKARTLAAQKQPAAELPGWVGLIEASCRYDRAPLETAMQAGPHAQLAAVLAFKTLEHSLCDHATLTLGMKVIEQAPEAYDAIDSMCRLNGQVGAGHVLTVVGPDTLAQTAVTRLDQFANVPAALAAVLAEQRPKRAGKRRVWHDAGETIIEGAGQRAALIRAVVAAGQPATDFVEPSWEAVGKALEDATLVQFYRRIGFLAGSLGLPEESLAEYFKTASEAVPDHPQKNLLVAQSPSVTRDAARLRALTKDMPHLDPTYSMDAAMRETWTGQKDKAYGQVAWNWLYYNVDDVARDLEQAAYSKKDAKLMHRLQKISPHSPQAVALLVAFDLPFAQSRLKQWEQDFGSQPVVLQALSKVFTEANRQTDAERTLKAFNAISPERWSIESLANIYWDQGNPKQWVETLEGALGRERFGLGDAMIQRRLAHYFLAYEKDPERALPYAEAAAATGAAWGVTVAAEVHEALEHWDTADKLMESVAQRYDASAFDWYFWCRRTGRGRPDAAKQLADAAAKKMALQAGDLDCQKLAIFFLLTERRPTAQSFFQRSFTRSGNPWSAIHAALLADDAGETDARDALLGGAVLRGEKYEVDGVKLFSTVALGRWLSNAATTPADKPLNIQRLEDVIKPVERMDRSNLCYFAYRFLKQRNPERAQQYLKRALATRAVSKYNYTLACVEARELGLEMPPADPTEHVFPKFDADPAEPRNDALQEPAAD